AGTTIRGEHPDNVMVSRHWIFAGAVLLAAVTGCSGRPPLASSPTATSPQSDRDHLAGLAAAAQGNAYVANYELTVPGLGSRTVTVAIGTDGSWVVGLPAMALSGLADIAMFQSSIGQFQCLLGPAAGTVGQRPDLGSLKPGCVKVTELTA